MRERHSYGIDLHVASVLSEIVTEQLTHHASRIKHQASRITHHDFPMKSSTRDMWEVNKYLWICLLFAAWFIYAAKSRGWITVPLPYAYAIYGLAILNGALRSIRGFRHGGNEGIYGWLFTLVDLILISAAVRITNGLYSELWLAYYVLLVSEALYSTTVQTTLLNACIVAGYVGATWHMRDAPSYWITIVTRMFFVVVVGSFGLRLSTDRERRQRELARLSEQVAASDERARIAREVHDGLGHALVASILRLELCRRLLKRDPEQAERILEEEVPALRAAWNEGRNLAFHLRPWERDPAGFSHSLRRHVSRFAERTGIAVTLDIDDTRDWNLPADVEIAVTRIVQEALTNVARHAQASAVQIRVERNDNNICCAIEDDGQGFDAESPRASFGLNAMRERAENPGGSFTLESGPGRGTTIEARIPLQRSNPCHEAGN
jgi:signal transduction histidine kinase